ncbi:MAG TPA: hypothetical protein VMV18_04085 [bacterium]|nr:hypothetical protein [bacterium]
MKKLALIVSITGIAALAAACGAVSNGGTASPTPTGSGTPTPTGTPSAAKIADINSGSIQSGAAVHLQGIVVTAVDSFGDFYAQDVGGGPNSGMFFFDKNHKSPASLAIGDELTLDGTFSPYSGPASSPWAIPENEVIPTSISQTNTGLTPTIDSVDIATLQSSLADTNGVPADKSFMGRLIQVTGNIQVTSVGMGFGEYAVGPQSSTTISSRVDRGLYDSFEPRLVGEGITTLIGVVAYDFNHYHIEPRSAADLVGNGTNTPMTVASINALLTSTTIQPGQLVTLSNVFVTGTAPYTNTSSNKTMNPFWGSDAATAAVNTGLYFEDPFYKNPTLVQGNKIGTVTGKYIVYGSTFKTHSIQIGFADMSVPTGSGTNTITPLSVPVANVKKGASNTAQYENVYVKLSDASLQVQAAVNSYGEYTVGTDATSNFVTVGKLATDTSAMGSTAGKTVTNAQGIVYFAHGLNYIEPLKAGDIAITP